ncbi:methyltransferase [Actinorhabdospora filicis]|uniref:Methyltransferase n=1 Tax=Actinorhabdospora filicis TaxID=1785913 RepID=A0A9W6W293_9ACTN|nr:class I SAM-dependent methyltransferase [Actinorhabdospora filicis]GLZ76762.1 methyltransferase [Actinorhabdospora filicis]
MSDSYSFSNSDAHSRVQLDTIEAYLDPITIPALAALDLPGDARCLEIGPGGGSIAHWLAARTGEVVAVDIDPSRVSPAPNLRIVQADIREGLPVEGEFDLIHARLVLLHLPAREEILRSLVARLRPGGHLLLGEFGEQPIRAYRTPGKAAEELFERVTRGILELVQAHGADMNWAYRAYAALAEAGLTGVYGSERSEVWSGGGLSLYRNNVQMKRGELLAAGFTEAELDAYLALWEDRGFAAPGYRFVLTGGRRP